MSSNSMLALVSTLYMVEYNVGPLFERRGCGQVLINNSTEVLQRNGCSYIVATIEFNAIFAT